MKSGAIAWVIGLVVAGGVLATIANRAPDSPQEREAQLEYEQRKENIANQREELKDDTRARKDQLAESTQARKADIKDGADQALDSLETKAERTEERIEDRAEQTQQALDRKLDAAKDEFQLSKEASENLNERDADRTAAADREAAVEAEEVSGTVTAINANTRTVSIREELSSSPTQPFRSPTQLNVDANAKVEHAGQRLSLSDVQAGDQVSLSIRENAGQRLVTNIIINQRAPGAVAR